LWRDVNPVLLRYLRVAAPGAAEDVAAETWVQVIRGLPGFCGDEGRGGHGCSRLPAGGRSTRAAAVPAAQSPRWLS
jgi:hypothetical protein